MSLTVLLLLDASRAWVGWRPASCYPQACFCEEIRNQIIRQPSNAISSLVFTVVGIAVLRREASSVNAQSQFAKFPYLPKLYAAALILIGLGSAFYHASLTFAGQFLDVFGMYLLATFILLMNLSRTRDIAASAAISAYVALNGALAASLLLFPAARRFLFALVLLLALICEPTFRRSSGAHTSKKYLIRALAAISLGFLVWVADITRTFCSPPSLIQGHAIWHILGAAATWELYKFYRTIEARV